MEDAMDLMPDGSRKRVHEEEGFPDALSFSEHRNKRVHCLPLRTSPQSSQHAMTAANSNSDEPMLCQTEDSRWISSSPNEAMDGDDVLIQPLQSLPQQLASEHDTLPSIMPQMKAQHDQNGIKNMGHHFVGYTPFQHGDQSVPRSAGQGQDWDNGSRPLPSPISDVSDSVLNQDVHHHHSSRPTTPQTMEHPMMDLAGGQSPHCHDTTDGEASSPSPTRRGHIRSKHTINSWTWQPGMKRSFSIGYRADCDKCQAKVPGHFNHIIIS